MVGLGCQMNEFRHDSPEVITDGSDLDYRRDVTERPVREIDLVLMYRVGWGGGSGSGKASYEVIVATRA